VANLSPAVVDPVISGTVGTEDLSTLSLFPGRTFVKILFDETVISQVELSEHSTKKGSTQYEWLLADLKENAKHRQERPWVIAFTHQMIYW